MSIMNLLQKNYRRTEPVFPDINFLNTINFRFQFDTPNRTKPAPSESEKNIFLIGGKDID